MAQRRMMSLKIIDTDLFMDMPLSSQCLYFHLMMRADDDGFIGNQKKIVRMVGCNDDDLKLLINKALVIPVVIPNGMGVIVIAHWKVHNFIRSDRYTETIYKEEKAMLELNNGTYQLSYQPDTEVRVRLELESELELELETNKEGVSKKPIKRFVPPTVEDAKKYGKEYSGAPFYEAEKFVDFYSSKNWMVGKNKMKDWQAACRNWIRRDKPAATSEPKETERAQARRDAERLKLAAEKENVDMPDIFSAIRRQA